MKNKGILTTSDPDPVLNPPLSVPEIALSSSDAAADPI